MELDERVDVLNELVSKEEVVLAGSSYGGLACALVAQQQPKQVKGLLLLAPALHLPESPNNIPENLVAPDDLPITIIHSTTDEIVPISASHDYIGRSENMISLIEVEDSHVLENSIELIILETKKLLKL